MKMENPYFPGGESGVESTAPKKKRYSLSVRIIAGVLAVALLAGLAANGFIRVRIRGGDESGAATNYLVNNTDYVNEGSAQRFQEKLLTLSAPSELEDHYRMAGIQIAEEDYSAALESIETCISLDNKSDPDLSRDLLMKQGCLLVLLGQPDRALTVLKTVSGMAPGYGDVHLVMAQIYSQRGDNDLLAETLERYLTLVPGDVPIRVILAQTYFAMEDFSSAQTHYTAALEKKDALDDPGQIHYLAALTQIQLGLFDKAEENLLAAAESSPEQEGLFYYLGVCQMARGGYQEAVENLTISIDSGSMVQLSRYSRGVCGLMLEGYDLVIAVEDIQAAAEYAGEDVDTSVSQQAVQLLESLLTPPQESE